MAKTPARLVAAIERHAGHMIHISEVLRVKRTVPAENQAGYLRDRSEDYWIGVAVGRSNALEEQLFEAKCYAGFNYIASNWETFEQDGVTHNVARSVSPNSPDFAEWRVQYYLKG